MKALDVFGCALDGTTLIEASAGTGKTWNICVLYLRLLLERALPVNKILVVTFTKAATGELRDRIRARIVQTLQTVSGAPIAPDPFVDQLLQAVRATGVTDDEIMQRLALARTGFDEAAIFTIHGFCQRALADAPFAAQMPLALDLLENDAELRRGVVNDFWRQRVLGDELEEVLLASVLEGDVTPETLDALLKRRLAKPLSIYQWPETPTEPPALDDLRTAHQAAREAWTASRGEVIALLDEAIRDKLLHANVYKPASVPKATLAWDAWCACPDASGILGAEAEGELLLGTAKLQRSTRKGFSTPSHPFFALAQRLLDEHAKAREAVVGARLAFVRSLLEEGAHAVRRVKRERRLVAFDDMLFNLYERLSGAEGEGLADALRARFPAALIDEFQDTDPLQFAIFRQVYARHRAPLFFVGDPKQAIYSFRNADLQTYLQARSHTDAQCTLAENQRSTPAVITALNTLFTRNSRAFMLAGLDYHPVSVGAKPRTPLADATLSRAALQVWRLPHEDGILAKPAAVAAAATACAAEISRLLQGAFDGKLALGERPLRAGDIAVLVRTHRQGRLMREALAALGIGSVELSQASVFHTPDAEEVERVLAAVLEPSRERLVRAALGTELLGRDAATLEALANDDAESVGLMAAFADYREEWLRHGVAAMLRQLMRREGVSERMLARPDGERRMTNLLHLVESLQAASDEHRSPQALLRWLQAARKDNGEQEAAQLRLESDRNLVQIVTIFKAKGLEYPIVFCPFLWDAPAPRQDSQGVEYHDPDGRAVVDFRPGARKDKDTKSQVALERCAEDLRLIYVALTRAVHRCYLVVGCVGGRSQKATARSGLNWLVAGQGQQPGDWLDGAPTPDAVVRAWQALAHASGGSVCVDELPTGAGERLALNAPSPDDIAARPAPAFIPSGWRTGGFSGMVQAGASRPAADHDADVKRQPAAPRLPVADDDILGFPRGMEAGTCLHAVFEHADFADPDSWAPAIEGALTLYPQPNEGPAGRARHERMLAAMMRDVTSVTLPAGFRLQDVPRNRRLDELEFHLPARGVTAEALQRLLHQHGYAMPALQFGRLDGYLNGFMDCVLEHGGRYYLLDWKSNHLGDTAESYAAVALDAAMAHHGYHLQYLLYAVALERFLTLRLRDYDRRTHFGGVMYLFVRGVRPGWGTPSAPSGIYAHTPKDAVMDALSHLFQPHRLEAA